MNIFARTLDGVFSDKGAVRGGLTGRVWFTGGVLLAEGLALMLFSQTGSLFLAVTTMVIFSLFVQMSEGATYAVVLFINKKALGGVQALSEPGATREPCRPASCSASRVCPRPKR